MLKKYKKFFINFKITFFSLNCYFVDLFVRVSNETAYKMYTNFGYVVYRRILKYYCDSEDAFGKLKKIVLKIF